MRRIASCSTAPSGTGRYSPFEHGPSLIGSSSSGSHAIARTLRPVRTAPRRDFRATSACQGAETARKSRRSARVAAGRAAWSHPRARVRRMVSILLIALLIVLAVGAAAGTSALVVSRHAADAPPAPGPGGHRQPDRAARRPAAAGGARAPHRDEPGAARRRAHAVGRGARVGAHPHRGAVRQRAHRARQGDGAGARVRVRAAAPRSRSSRARSRPQRAGIAELASTAQGLREALASSKTRGQWGERMAEDVLRLAGFVEGVQYRKQKAVAQGTRHPGLHVPPAPGRDPLHGREVPARQLRPLRQRRERARAGALPRRLREGRAGPRSRSSPSASTRAARSRASTASCSSSRTSSSTRSSRSTRARCSTTRCATGS